MSTPIAYPLLNGVRQSFVSTEIRFAAAAIGTTQAGQTLSLNLRGYKSCNYGRTRDRTIMYGNHPDPIGKTRGKNAYKCEVEWAIAEFLAIQNALIALTGGTSGYGDVLFSMQITHSENGFDTIVDTVSGCTLDMDEMSLTEGTEATYQKMDLHPLKVLRNGFDDVQFPLTPIVQ
jgi:hypothetical protein